jgi:hypothetical protein
MGGTVSAMMGIFAFLVSLYSKVDQKVALVMDSFKILVKSSTPLYSKTMMNKRMTSEDIKLLCDYQKTRKLK